MMPADLKNCPEGHNCSRWWLAEEKTRGWDDTGELPANEICLLRPIITVSLKDLINILEKWGIYYYEKERKLFWGFA